MIKVDNAIIMAAGMSTRFVPLSIDKPKALIKVKNEVLIERMIKQLREKNIQEIIIVTGYKSETLEYLKEKFNVILIHNPEYNTRNNHASLYYAQDYLKNSYICSADNYYPHNVFNYEETASYYSTVFEENETEEWCVSTDVDGYINHIQIGGQNSDIMLGHVFFDEQFSKQLVRIINEHYNENWIKPMLWESVFQKYLSQLKLKIKRHEKSEILEFDSLKELKKFDKWYKTHSESKTLDDLSIQLNTTFDKLKKIKPLTINNELIGFKFKHKKKKYSYLLDSQLLFSKSRLISGEHIDEIKVLIKDKLDITEKIEGIWKLGGLTNYNYYVKTKKNDLVVRFAGKGTNELICRADEGHMIEANRQTDIDSEVLYFDPLTGIKITRYINHAQTMNSQSIQEPHNLKLVAKLLKKLHTSNVSSRVDFDVWGKVDHYESLIQKIEFPNYRDTKEKIKSLAILQNESVFCHNDPLCENFVLGSDRMYLVDWEYAGNNNPMWDLAALIVESDLDEKKEKEFIAYYFKKKETKEDLINILYMKVLLDFLWSLWGLYMVEQGAPYLDYGITRYNRACENLERLLKRV